jgi:hypothetical protein
MRRDDEQVKAKDARDGCDLDESCGGLHLGFPISSSFGIYRQVRAVLL